MEELQMYCENCGKKLEEGARFCSGCGHPTGIGQPPQMEPAKTSPEKELLNSKAFIAAGIAFAVLLAGGLFFSLTYTDPIMKQLEGYWEPINCSYGESVVIDKKTVTTMGMTGKITDYDEDIIRVEYDDGSTGAWMYAVEEHGLLWLREVYNPLQEDDEFIEAGMAVLYCNTDQWSAEMDGYSDWAGTYADEDMKEDYMDYLLGEWRTEDAWDLSGDKYLIDEVSFFWDEDGSYNISYRLENSNYDDEDSSLMIDSDGTLISIGDHYLISMAPLDEDVCAVYIYGESSTPAQTFVCR